MVDMELLRLAADYYERKTQKRLTNEQREKWRQRLQRTLEVGVYERISSAV